MGRRPRLEPHDAELIIRDSDTVMHWIAVYREHIETSNAIAAATDLDAPCARTDLIECNMRYVLFHMIEEAARHAGHADIIRETLDCSRGSGAVGLSPASEGLSLDRNRRYQLNRTLVPISVRVKQGNKLLRGDVGWNGASAAPSGR